MITMRNPIAFHCFGRFQGMLLKNQGQIRSWECGNILDRLHGIAQASPSPRYRVVHLAPAFVERLEPAVHVPFDVGVEPRPELVEPHLRPVAAVVELLLQRPEEA